MSNEKFTPGPWEADCRLGVFVIRPEGDSVRCLSGASNDSIVYQEGRGMPNSNYRYLTEEQEANARLIAAAPEMYEVLNILNELGGLGHEKHDLIERVLAKVRSE